jgi:hypothetical protein
MTKKIPVTFVSEKLAVKGEEAARMLDISTSQLWRLVGRGKIKKTSYGTYPIFELQRHLLEETYGPRGSRYW